MSRLLPLPLVLATLLVPGCGGGTRFDATSEVTAKASMEAMTAGLTQPEKEAFAKDVMTVVMLEGLASALKAASPGTPGPSPSTPKFGSAEMYRPINGLTRAEIHAKAEALRTQSGLPAKAR